jgi:hypothetical protein
MVPYLLNFWPSMDSFSGPMKGTILGAASGLFPAHFLKNFNRCFAICDQVYLNEFPSFSQHTWPLLVTDSCIYYNNKKNNSWLLNLARDWCGWPPYCSKDSFHGFARRKLPLSSTWDGMKTFMLAVLWCSFIFQIAMVRTDFDTRHSSFQNLLYHSQ